MKIRNIKYKVRFSQFVILVLATVFLSSCDSFLDIKESEVIKQDDYWKTKEDLVGVLGSAYNGFRSKDAQRRFFLWGEARADLFVFAFMGETAIYDIMRGNLETSNKYVQWSSIYNPINSANLVLDKIDEVKSLDYSFTDSLYRQWKSEALFLRSLGFYHLTCTFGDIPMPLFGYESDSQDRFLHQTPRKEVFQQIVIDLNEAITLGLKDYPAQEDFHGRATINAMRALLANAYLWLDEADACIEQCDLIIGSGLYALLGPELWFDSFYPGNSNENIFELQFNLDVTSNIGVFTSNDGFKNSSHTFAPSISLVDLYEGLDMRGFGATINYSASSLRKYTYDGATFLSDYRGNDANWIFYRLADVYLMRAEAYILKNEFTNAVADLDLIRVRAGILPYNEFGNTDPFGTDRASYYESLLDERARELAGEGKRWFDLQRIASREDYRYKSMLVDRIMINVPISFKPIMEVRLNNPDFWLFPIYQNEIEANENLVQNQFYAN